MTNQNNKTCHIVISAWSNFKQTKKNQTNKTWQGHKLPKLLLNSTVSVKI